MSRVTLSPAEQLTALVYGDTFALYDDEAFDEFLEPLKARLAINGIDARVFAGARCLDAGCGGGRGSVLMAEASASQVVAVDLSETNVASTRRRAALRGLPHVNVQQHSLMELPFADASFDIVWCNGVLHHTADPDRGLQEITRVLKPGGHLWLYLYGVGGIYWRVIDWIRATLRDLDVRECIRQLQVMQVPVRRIGEWIDDWFVPYLYRYRSSHVTDRLQALGYADVKRLEKGMPYDTSQRRLNASREEARLMGEGDLRFFCTKGAAAPRDLYRLPDASRSTAADFQESPEVAQLDKVLGDLTIGLDTLDRTRPGNGYRTVVCIALHAKVRALLEAPTAFDTVALYDYIAGYAGLMNAPSVRATR